MWMTALVVWLACGGPIEPHPAAIVDGDPPAPEGPWALVGQAIAPPPTGFMADVQRVSDQVVLVGDAVHVTGSESWRRLGERWAELPVLPLRGSSERRLDPRGRRFAALWPRATPWGRVELGPHRMVWLDASDPVDQRFWLPAALARPPGGVVVVMAEPNDEVERQVRDAVPPEAFAILVQGGAPGNRASLPQGRWGPMMLSVGPVEGGVLEPIDGAEAFHAAQRAVLARELPASSWALRPEATLKGALGPGGWWVLDADELGVTVALRRRGNDGRWHASYRARWRRDAGWEEQTPTRIPGSTSTPTAP